MAADQQPLQSSVRVEPPPPPQKRTCTGYNCCKILVLIFGFIFFIIGLVLVGIGVYAETLTSNYGTINEAVHVPAILAILCGIAGIIVALCGIIGALKEKVILLKIFLGTIIIIFILQVVIGILIFVFREEATDELTERVTFAIESYHEVNKLQNIVDEIQSKYDCCGLVGPSDWDKNEVYACSKGGKFDCSVPGSCCNKDLEQNFCGDSVRRNASTSDLRSNGIHLRGCYYYFIMWIKDNLDKVGATALALAIPQIFGMFIVYIFIQKVRDRKLLFKYRKRVWQDN